MGGLAGGVRGFTGLAPLTVRAYRHVIPDGTYHFPRAIEGDNLSQNTLRYVFAARRTLGQFRQTMALRSGIHSNNSSRGPSRPCQKFIGT